jgi:hypothetical protein
MFLSVAGILAVSGGLRGQLVGGGRLSQLGSGRMAGVAWGGKGWATGPATDAGIRPKYPQAGRGARFGGVCSRDHGSDYTFQNPKPGQGGLGRFDFSTTNSRRLVYLFSTTYQLPGVE